MVHGRGSCVNFPTRIGKSIDTLLKKIQKHHSLNVFISTVVFS